MFVEVFGTADKTVTISPVDNSLVVDDASMVNIDSLKSRGLKESHPDFAEHTSYSSIHDPDIALWPCGNSELAIVDLMAFEYDIVGKFFLGDDLGYLPMNLKSYHSGRKVLGLTMLKQSKHFVVSYWNKVEHEESVVVTKSVKAIDGQGNLI